MTTADKNISIDFNRVPKHVAIIMDGNGRWAKAKGQERTCGHEQGVTSVRNVIREANALGIKYLTLYAFSTENWNRPQHEVDVLMSLIVMAMSRELPEMLENNVTMRIIGDISRLPEDARQTLDQCVAATAHCTGLNMILALSYSSRWEITEAVKAISSKVAVGELKAEDINDDIVSQHLATAEYPDPDLLIRTGGDVRVSNYLLWQIAYSELYFTPTLWPDFDGAALRKAVAEYQQRERRYGLISEQLTEQ
ncbi:MAG: isoprenyl transferase [Paramuribaculum sp.]|nr:isoprenyl transferase [Paramuribaculum sp.]